MVVSRDSDVTDVCQPRVGRREIDPDGITQTRVAAVTGEQLDRYVLGAELARGTFGRVFAARDTHLDRDVAIKLLHPEYAAHHEIKRRFVREASATAKVHHPGIVTILDWGEREDGAYLVMDLLDGESLSMRLSTVGRLLPHDAVEIVRQAADALAAAHAVGVLHRDLKPDNLFLVSDPSMPIGVRLKILDFGLAKQVGSTWRTGMLTLLGTPQYMSPEQCRCATDLDCRTDIYSLGCILFELVTGDPPYDGDIEAQIHAHQHAPIPRASQRVACPPQLDALITWMLAKDRLARPQTMADVRRALDDLSMGRLGSSSELAWLPQRVAVLGPRPAAQAPTMIGAWAIASDGASSPPRRPGGYFAASTIETLPLPPRQLLLLAIACAITGVLLGMLV